MIKRSFSFILFTTLISTANAKQQPVSQIACLMNRPMITGASVSAGLDGFSFGDQLAAKCHAEKRVIHEAYPGTAGAVVVAYPHFAAQAKKASIVMALDFFYWDQLSCDEQKITLTVDTLFRDTVKKGIALVVGNLVPGYDPFNKIKYEDFCAPLINQKVKAACDLNPKKCLFVDHAEVLAAIAKHFKQELSALVEPERQKHVAEHITRDGMHRMHNPGA